MKHFSFRRVSALLLACLCLLSLVGCAGGVRASSNAKKVVATAGNVEITYDELYYLANTRIKELKDFYGEQALQDPARRADLEEFVWDNLLGRSHAMISLGLDYGVDVERGEIASSVDTHMEQILQDSFAGDKDAYIQSLNGAYLTDRYVRTYVAVENYLGVQIIKKMLEAGVLDGSDAAADAHIRGDQFIRVRQVLIETRNYKDAASALAKAQALQAKVAAAEGDAARNDAMLDAMQFSTSLDTTGDGLYFTHGEMEQRFEDAAFALPLYGVSEVMQVKEGYTFVMRLPKEDAYISEHFETLKNQSYLVALNAAVDKRLSEMTLTKTAFGESLDLMALPTIDADGGKGAYVAVAVGAIALVGVAAAAGVHFWVKRRRSA